MRKLTTLFAAAGLAVLAAGCSGDTAAPTAARPVADPLLEKLAAAGFDITGARDLGDRFRVEGDIEIAKSTIASWRGAQRPGDPRFQWSTTSLVGQNKIYGIKVDVSGLASVTDWQTAARSALTQWNGMGGSAVYLVEGSPAAITVTTGYDADCGVAAWASWPDGVNPGTTIHVNTNYCGSPNNSSTKLRNIVHELGHTIGFRHTNWQARGEGTAGIGAVQVPGTPATDGSSVMNGGTATTSWAGFSTNDITATRTLYPSVSSVVINNPPLERVVGGFAFWVSYAAYGASGNYLSGKAAQSVTVDNSSVAQVVNVESLQGLQAGSTTLRMTVDGVQTSAAVQVVDITVSGPSTLAPTQSGTYTASITGPGGPYVPLYWDSGEGTAYCLNQSSCTLTGSQLGETYVEVVFRNNATGMYLQKALPVNQ